MSVPCSSALFLLTKLNCTYFQTIQMRLIACSLLKYQSELPCCCIYMTVSLLDEECVQQGVEYIPFRLKQKKPKYQGEDVNQGRAPKHSNGMWEPASSGEDNSDSEDSMSDLYPRQYTLEILLSKTISGREKKYIRGGKNCPLYFVSCVSIATMFTVKNPEGEQMEAKSDDKEDGFQTDDSEEMEVDKQVQQKRKKVCLK